MRVVAGSFSPSRMEQSGLFAQCLPVKKTPQLPALPAPVSDNDNLEGIARARGSNMSKFGTYHSLNVDLLFKHAADDGFGSKVNPVTGGRYVPGSGLHQTPEDVGYAGPRSSRAVRGGRPARRTAPPPDLSASAKSSRARRFIQSASTTSPHSSHARSQPWIITTTSIQVGKSSRVVSWRHLTFRGTTGSTTPS